MRHALRLGLLREGDQLPTVKEVVAELAINPNTVLKAYRELERDGLVAARPGVGTFVTRTLTDATLASHGPLRKDLRALAQQGAARRPRRREHRGPVLHHLSVHLTAGGRMTLALRTDALTQELRAPDGAGGLHAGGAGGPRRRPGRAQRRRQEHAAEPRGRDAGADRPGRSRCCGEHAAGPGSAAGRVRRAGHADVRPSQRRRAPAPRRASSTRAGTRTWRAAGSSGSASTAPSGPRKLSGGQRAQLALTLGLAKRPELLILDEPVASLDPLARREFLQDLMEAVAEHEL